MTVTTELDARAYFCALWVQNELIRKRMMFPVRVAICAVVLLVSFPFLPVSDPMAWVIRAALCAAALLIHNVFALRARRRVFTSSAEKTIAAAGGSVYLEYRFDEEGFTMKKSGEPGETTPYEDVTGLCETPDVLLILVGSKTIHAVKKSALEDALALKTLLAEKTGCFWKQFKL